MKSFQLSGLLLSLIGAGVDILSSFSITLSQDINSANQMVMSFDPTFLILPLDLLSILLIVTGILSITSLAANHARIFAALMIVYSLAMINIGYIMYSNSVMTSNMILIGISMIVLGSAMLVNGGIMLVMNPRRMAQMT